MENLSSEDIIIKCSLEEMIRAFFNDYVIVWHDPNLTSQENQHYMAQLKKFCQVLTFTEWQKASLYIKETKAICHVITSGTNGELLAKAISSYANFANLYVFCRNKEYHLTWAQKYQKVSCVETNIQSLLSQIQQNLFQWYRQRSSLKLNLPAFAPIFNDGDKSQMNHLHRYLKVIPNFHNREQAKNDIVKLSKGIYLDEENIKLIADFEKNYNEYSMEGILRWYTQESFLYKVTNNCLRIATSDSIQYSRFLLRDIEQAIKDQYKNKSKDFNGLLYRGCYLSDKEWTSLKENVYREIEMHGFMSVSKEKKVALSFMGIDPSKKVFVTIIVPKGPNEEEQGFAEIEEFSRFPDEKEILFNVRSRFVVLETEEVPYRHVVLLYGVQGFSRWMTEKNPVEEVEASNVGDIPCGNCEADLEEEGIAFIPIKQQHEKPIYYCKKCAYEQDLGGPFLCVPVTETPEKVQISGCALKNLTKTPFYGYECWQCKVRGQERYFICVDCSSEFQHTYCEDCLGDCMENGHRIVMETNAYTFWCQKMTASESSHLQFQQQLMKKSKVFQQPEMYFESHEYEKAMKYYVTYLERCKVEGADENTATAYDHIGSIYKKRGEYKKALEHHMKALGIYKKVHGESHYDVAAAYHNMGSVYNHQADYKNAMDCYMKCLEIYKSTYGEQQHPRIATVYGSLANVFEGQGEYKKAAEYHNRALGLRKLIYGEDHPHVATSYNDLGNLSESQGNYQIALSYYFKSLEIDKSIYGENHPNIAASYNNIGSSYDQLREYKKALEFHLKALQIYSSVYEENHPNIATCYNNIGMVKMNEGAYGEAREYLGKALGIRRLIYGENHPNIAASYQNLGMVFLNEGKYKEAYEYLIKALEVRRLLYGENHPNIAAVYGNIASVFEKQGEYLKALEYHNKALEVRKLLYGENHASIASCYRSIGMAYLNKKDYKKAEENLVKALEVTKLVHGEHSPHADMAREKLSLISDRKVEDEEEQKSKTFLGFIGQAFEALFGGGKKGAKLKKKKEKEKGKGKGNNPISHHGQDKIPKTVPLKGGHGMISHPLERNQEVVNVNRNSLEEKDHE